MALGVSSSFNAELVAAMKIIDIAWDRQWHSLWLETDSSLVVHAFQHSNLVLGICVTNGKTV